MVLKGCVSLREASDRMEISYQHAKRLKGVVARDGPGGLVHGNTVRRPGNVLIPFGTPKVRGGDTQGLGTESRSV